MNWLQLVVLILLSLLVLRYLAHFISVVVIAGAIALVSLCSYLLWVLLKMTDVHTLYYFFTISAIAAISLSSPHMLVKLAERHWPKLYQFIQEDNRHCRASTQLSRLLLTLLFVVVSAGLIIAIFAGLFLLLEPNQLLHQPRS